MALQFSFKKGPLNRKKSSYQINNNYLSIISLGCCMGRCKFKLGRSHKNYERKRQSSGKNPIGRPSKDKKGKEEVYTSILMNGA